MQAGGSDASLAAQATYRQSFRRSPFSVSRCLSFLKHNLGFGLSPSKYAYSFRAVPVRQKLHTSDLGSH